MCDQCNATERKRQELMDALMDNPLPCIICGGDPLMVSTYIPGTKTRLAVGATDKLEKIFAFCLCENHSEATRANEKLIIQAIIRDVQQGSRRTL